MISKRIDSEESRSSQKKKENGYALRKKEDKISSRMNIDRVIMFR